MSYILNHLQNPPSYWVIIKMVFPPTINFPSVPISKKKELHSFFYKFPVDRKRQKKY